MSHVTLLDLTNWFSYFITLNTVISLILPPVEYFDAWPRFQQSYTVFVKIITRYASLNFRGAIVNNFLNKGVTNGTPKQQAVASDLTVKPDGGK